MATPVGQMYATLDLDDSGFKKGQQNAIASANATVTAIDDSYKTLGIKSDAMYQAMKQQAEKSYQTIALASQSTANDIVRAEMAKFDIIKRLNEEQAASTQTSADKMIASLKEVGEVAVQVAGIIATTMWAFTQGAELGGLSGGLAAGGVALAVELAAAFGAANAQASDLDDTLMKILDAKKTLLVYGATEQSINAEINSLIGDQLTTWSKLKETFPEIIQNLLKWDQGWSEAIGQSELSLNSMFKNMGESVDNFILSIEKPRDVIDGMFESETQTQLRELTKQLVQQRDAVDDGTRTFKEQQEARLQLYVAYKIKEQAILAESAQKEIATYQNVMAGLGLSIGQAQSEQAMNSIIQMLQNKFSEVAAIEEKSNTLLLNNAEAAHEIRLAKEKEFGDKLVKTVEDYAQRAFEAQRKASGADILEQEAIDAGNVIKKLETDITASTQLGHSNRVKAIKAELEDRVNAAMVAGKSAIEIDQMVKNAERVSAEKLDAENKRMNPEKGVTDAERLAEAWVEMSKSLDVKMAGADVDELSKKLIDIQGEAEKLARRFETIPEAGAKIAEWAKAMSDAAVVRSDAATTQKTLEDLRAEQDEISRVSKAYATLSARYSLTLETELAFAQGSKIIQAALDKEIISAEQAAKALEALQVSLDVIKTDKYVNFYQEITGFENQYRDAKLASIEAQRKADITRFGDIEAANAKANQAAIALDAKTREEKIQNVASTMGASSTAFETLSQLYKEDSNERKRLHEVAMAFNAAEKVSLAALAVEKAIVAIASQASIPVVGFALAGAMAAAMAALLAIGGIGFAGGGMSSGVSSSYSGTAATQGSSGVLGAETGTGSNSIADSYALLKDTYSMEDTKLTRIYMELRDLNHNITGLVTSIVRTGGIGMAVDVGTTMGAAQSQFNSVIGSSFPGIDFLSSYVTGLLSSVVGSIFGGDTSTWVSAVGIAFGQATVQSLLDGIPIVAKQFAVISTQVSGGLFSSGSFSQEWRYADLDAQVNAEINKIFVNMSKTLLAIGEGLGTDLQQVYDYVFKAQTTPDLLGMTTEQMNKALNDYFSSIMDTAVNDLFGTILQQYQKIDESMLETAVRVINDKETIVRMLDMTNHAFVGTDEEAIALSETLIGLAGDLSALTDAATTYYDKFTSDAQKQLDLQKQLSDAMASVNQMTTTTTTDPATGQTTTTSLDLILPATRDAYRALVEGLDLTTAAGQQAYVALLQLSGSADQYYTSLENAAAAIESASKSYADYYNSMMGFTTSLGKQLDDVQSKYADYIATAVEYGLSTEQITQMYQEESDIIEKILADWVKGVDDYYNQMMGNTSSLQSQIDANNAKYSEYIKEAQSQGASAEQIAHLYQEQADINNKLTNDSATAAATQAAATQKSLADQSQAYIEYYNSIMYGVDNLGAKITDANKKFAEYVTAATEAGASTEELAGIYQNQAEVINKIISDYTKSLAQPFIDLGISMYGWAQGVYGISDEIIARTQLMLHGWSGATDFASVKANISNMSSNTDIENYLKDLNTYYTAVASAIEKTYDALQSTKKSLYADIAKLAIDQKTGQSLADYYMAQGMEVYNKLSTLSSEQMPDAINSVHDSLMNYYAAEKQVIQDKYKTETDLINKKHSDEIANIQAVRDKLQSLTYSAYNLALPTQKATSAQGDYAKLFAAAQTGDASSVSKFLSFTDTYLKSGQDAYKSSQQYLDMYAKVMADIQSLDTNPAKTVADLTDEQNKLIADQTAAMNAEITKLNQDTASALNALTDITDSASASTMAQLVGIYDTLTSLAQWAYGYEQSRDSANSETQSFESWVQSDLYNGLIRWYADEITCLNNIAYNTAMVADVLGRAGKYRDGGDSYGPESGYPVILHGAERITPLNKVGKAGGSDSFNDPEIKQLLGALVVQGTRNQNVIITLEDGKTLKGIIRREADQLDQDRLERGIKNRTYR